MQIENYAGLMELSKSIGLGSCDSIYRMRSGSGRVIINGNQGGLLNRVFPLLSLLSIAEEEDATVYSLWDPNDHCAAHLHDLFKFEPAVLEVVDEDIGKNDIEVFNNYHNHSNRLIPQDVNLLIHSCVPLHSHNHVPLSQDVANQWNKLTKVAWIEQAIAELSFIDSDEMLGVHVRMPFQSGAHSEQETSKFSLSAADYVDIVRQVIDQRDFARIFLCTNNSSAHQYFTEAFPDKIIRQPVSCFDNTTSARAVGEAVVDIELLSKCGHILSHEQSAWGWFAEVIGKGVFTKICTVENNRWTLSGPLQK